MRKSPYLGTVVGIRIYQNDVEVVREGRAPNVRDHERSEITEFSRKSRMRLAFVASNTPVVFKTMITLTYPNVFPTDGKAVKVHLNRFLCWLRRELGRPQYLWFLEFQRRGAPHIHIMLDWYPGRTNDVLHGFRFRCSSSWYRFVGSRDEKHLAAGTRVERLRNPDGARRYAVKYAAKMTQKHVPKDFRNVGRFWGCSRVVVPQPEGEVQCTEDDIRGLLEGWEFAPDEQRPVYRVLYNQADRFRAYCSNQLDDCSE